MRGKRLVIALGLVAVAATLILLFYHPPADSDRGRLAFSAQRRWSSGINLYVTNVDRPRRLTTLTRGPDFNSLPSWSPDGERIAYSCRRNGSPDGICITTGDGSAPPQLVWDGARHPAWSPCGRYLAGTVDGQLFLLDLLTQKESPVNMGELTSAHIYAPSWSPDGKRLVFEYYPYSIESTEESIEDWGGLAIANIDGTGFVQLTHNRYRRDDHEPTWSPLGDRIAYLSYRDTVHQDVWTIKPDGSHAIRLTHGAVAGNPSWSPDGLWIAFPSSQNACWDLGFPWSWCRNEIHVMRTDGSQRHVVRRNWMESIYSIAWAPK